MGGGAAAAWSAAWLLSCCCVAVNYAVALSGLEPACLYAASSPGGHTPPSLAQALAAWAAATAGSTAAVGGGMRPQDSTTTMPLCR